MQVEQLLLEYEVQLRLGAFITIFALVAVGEILAPKRTLKVARRRRWLNNVSLVVINTIMLRLLFPTAAMGLAIFVNDRGWGLLNYWQLNPNISLIFSIVLLDMVIYLQHVMFHAVPLLWRLHKVHHTDLDYDVTTGARFHPVEIILSLGIKFFTILALGAPVVAVLIFEIILNAMAMFNHGNLDLPRSLDRLLRLVIVTPDMHRVHHSIEDDELNSNFGFNLSVWDRFFGTYKAQPLYGHQGMTIGLRNFSDEKKCVNLKGMLLIPFDDIGNNYTINRRQYRSK